MTTTLLLTAVAIAVLLAVSAFFSGSETALTAVSRARMHQLEKDGNRAARDVNALIADRQNMIGAILLGNTFINILVSSLATAMLTARFGHDAVAITTAAMTLLILIFAEVLPKTLAIVRTDSFALAAARTLRGFVAVLSPIVRTVQFVVWRVLRLFGVRPESGEPIMAAHEELRGAVALHHIEGGMEREHRNMIGGILDLTELEIGDVMVHRKNVAMIDAALPPEQMLDALIAARHTRVPVWRDTTDNVIGVLNAKDVMREFLRRRGRIQGLDLEALMAEPWFVPDTTSLEEQLGAFRERRSHFALVVDEYGAIQGIVTLEDILGEIIGAMPEESDVSRPPGIRPQPDGSYNIDGVVPVRDINRALDWELPDEEATTLAGLVIHEARTIPEIGQRFAFYGFQFEILRRQRNQITAIRVTPPQPASAL
ncbi:MAG: HlyC/CorC family transporter [Pseudomonadota bacterium]|nr:HlyC/CorC family transporter [Pseudomonadota bacterium]